jgi:hypothetical protein
LISSLINRASGFAVANGSVASIRILISCPDRRSLTGTERIWVSSSTALVRLSYLAPDIIQAILDGRQPRNLTPDKLLAHSRLPLAWHDQRTTLGFA